MIKKLFRQMLVTQIVSAMTVMLCMLIDSIMIGRFLGLPSMTAYGLATPVLLVFAALGSMIAAGVQVICGRTIASGDTEGTNACYTVSVMTSAGIALAGMAAVLLFTDPICTLLGAGTPSPDNEVFRLTRDYLRGFIIGAPAFILSQIMVPFLQIAGSRTRLVAAVLAMTAGDVVMDLLNVFVLKQGTFGMGLASSVSYYIAFVIGIVYFLRKSCIFKLRPKLYTWKVCARMLRAGVPTMINQVSLVLLTFTLNKLLLSVGSDLAVASYSVISTVGNICYSFSSGPAAVVLTLSSLFYTDSDRSALKELVGIMTRYCAAICAAVTIAVILLAAPLATLFLENPAAKDMTVTGLRLFVLSLVPCGLNTCFKNYDQGIERVRLTCAISVCQNFVLTALSAFVLSRFLGVTGIWLGYLCGEGLTLLLITAYVFVQYGKPSFTAEAFSLLPETFGAAPDSLLETRASEREQVLAASEEAAEFCRAHSLSEQCSMAVSLCIEEMGMNIVEYGFAGRNTHEIDIRLVIQEESVILRIRDNCAGFDPVEYTRHQKEEDLTKHIGLRMVMALTKDAEYVNSLGLNCLTLTLQKA